MLECGVMLLVQIVFTGSMYKSPRTFTDVVFSIGSMFVTLIALSGSITKSPVIDIAAAVVVPVKVGLSRGAFKFSCVVVAALTGLAASLVSLTLVSCTIAFVIPPTVPVKVGLARGALFANKVVIVVEKLLSLFIDDAISCKVSNIAGAVPINALILVVTSSFVYASIPVITILFASDDKVNQVPGTIFFMVDPDKTD